MSALAVNAIKNPMSFNSILSSKESEYISVIKASNPKLFAFAMFVWLLSIKTT